MGAFIVIGLVEASLAGTGAYWGHLSVDAPERVQHNAAVQGAVLALFLGFLGILSLVFTEISHLGWDAFKFISAIWGVHALMVGGVATFGISVAFEKGNPARSGWGAAIACVLGCPFTCWHLILLTLF